MIIVLGVLVLVLAAGSYVVLLRTGLIPGAGRERGYLLPELPGGCLVTAVVAGVLWFGAWGVVLVLALRFLTTGA
ncbi:MAG: hypothetical protein ACRD0D_02535 [Acidimicrobiales bacterium]